MNRYRIFGRIAPSFAVTIALGIFTAAPAALAADAPAADAAPASPVAAAPDVKPSGPGIFSAKKISPSRFRLTVTGHAFTSRQDTEKYLAYRAAELAMEQKYTWFSFIEQRTKGEALAAPKRDPAGMRFSFRMEFFRPAWRYKTAAAPNWKSWSPFSGAAFWADSLDPKSVTAFEVSADIGLHKGQVEGDNPLAFDASTVSDFLANQVQPPQ